VLLKFLGGLSRNIRTPAENTTTVELPVTSPYRLDKRIELHYSTTKTKQNSITAEISTDGATIAVLHQPAKLKKTLRFLAHFRNGFRRLAVRAR